MYGLRVLWSIRDEIGRHFKSIQAVRSLQAHLLRASPLTLLPVLTDDLLVLNGCVSLNPGRRSKLIESNSVKLGTGSPFIDRNALISHTTTLSLSSNPVVDYLCANSDGAISQIRMSEGVKAIEGPLEDKRGDASLVMPLVSQSVREHRQKRSTAQTRFVRSIYSSPLPPRSPPFHQAHQKALSSIHHRSVSWISRSRKGQHISSSRASRRI